MTQHDRLSELFLKACALAPGERGVFLDDACSGESQLRAELEAMLAADARASGILGARVGAVASDVTGTRPAPAWIGAYRILALLGEGGMGIVYHAEQQAPVRREVALKLVRGELASAGAVARFEAERQALAQMEHPSIARLFDAGTTEDGRPYFVMELVHGVPISEHCRTQGLAVRERVALFLEVARAVRHAHRRGVIHRDLKPSNILVEQIGDRPVPKVIDFSIAKAVGQSALDTEFRTRTGQVVGTLEYMSPEQAMGRVEAVDTRSDVYALGCVLYELIADRPPQDVANLPLHEAVQRIVRDPPKPLRGTRTTTTHRLDPDLETIVGKCLEKQPERRYGSASELVEDLERYIDSRPILARPPSTIYQLRKLVGRHRAGFLVAVLLFTFLVVFSITVTIQLERQRRERARAEAAARKADRVTEFLRDAFKAASGDTGFDATVKQMLDAAAAKLERERDREPDADAAIRQTLGRALSNFGEYAPAEKLLRQALAGQERRLGPNHPDVGVAHRDLAGTLGAAQKGKEAEQEARRALQIHEAQAKPDPRLIAQDLEVLGEILLGAAKEHEAEEVTRRQVKLYEEEIPKDDRTLLEMADAKEHLADALQRRGADAESEAIVREVLELRQRIAGEVPTAELARTQSNLAFLMFWNDRYAEAEPLCRAALATLTTILGPRHVQVGDQRRQLANCLRALGRYQEAEKEVKEAASITQEGVGADTPAYASVLVDLEGVYFDQGRYHEALAVARQALGIQRKTLGDDNVIVAQRWRKIGEMLGLTGQYAEAEAAYRTPQPVADKLPSDDLQVAWIVGGLAQFLTDRERFREAWPLNERSFPIVVKRLDPESPVLAVAKIQRARILDGLGRFEDANALREEGLATLRRVSERDVWIAWALRDRAHALRLQGRLAEASTAADQAVAASRRAQLTGALVPALVEQAEIESRCGVPARAAAREALSVWSKTEYVNPQLLARARRLAGG